MKNQNLVIGSTVVVVIVMVVCVLHHQRKLWNAHQVVLDKLNNMQEMRLNFAVEERQVSERTPIGFGLSAA